MIERLVEYPEWDMEMDSKIDDTVTRGKLIEISQVWNGETMITYGIIINCETKQFTQVPLHLIKEL